MSISIENEILLEQLEKTYIEFERLRSEFEKYDDLVHKDGFSTYRLQE